MTLERDTEGLAGKDYNAILKADGLAGHALFSEAFGKAKLALSLKQNHASRFALIDALRSLRAATDDQIQRRDTYQFEAERLADVMDSTAFLTSQKIRLADIARSVCRRTGVRLSEIRSKTKTRHIARPRQEIMYLACALTSLSMPAIGAYLHRDHTTVLHGARVHEERMKEVEA